MVQSIVDRKRSNLKSHIVCIFKNAKQNNESITYQDISRILTIRYEDAKKICEDLVKSGTIKLPEK